MKTPPTNRKTDTKPAARKAKPQKRLRSHVAHAAMLQQRVATGEATPGEAQEYQRIINEYRRKYRDGQLSPASARLFGID
jgi:hypothetical protein